ncbi:protein CHROMATIN REMODELING 24 [Macadamia integrifolia]|uniref:protein CHROMATIN REMODELING 24 n=1 Tax=Macadamia integrifolia TaxID=60698 RepID=UPI001C4E9FB9|nr:protein CHROMATIN REMODELING 24 [Macadamia integrifolia]
MAEKEEPMSLNQRHARLLKDFSSQSRSSKPDKPSKVKLEGRRRLCKLSSHDNISADEPSEPNFGGITDFDSPPVNTPVGNPFEPTFAGITDFDSRPVKSNVTDTTAVAGNPSKPSFSGITTDFDSPPAKANKNVAEEGNEITDILNDLSSRLHYLSIEKKRIPKAVESSPLLGVNEAPKHNEDIDDVPDYESASSSIFSVKSSRSDFSSGSARVSSVGDNVGTAAEEHGVVVDEEGDSENDAEGDNFYVSRRDTGKGGLENDSSTAGEKAVSTTYSVVSDDSDGGCVVLSSGESGKRVKPPPRAVEKEVRNAVSVNISEDDGSNSVSEDEFTITLSGAKLIYRLPGKIANMLFPHQRDGLKWLWALHCRGTGGILGDDMGLGKTMQMCSFLAGLFHSCLIKRALVVAPKTLLSHWIKELSLVGLGDKTREYFGTCVKARQYELQYILQDKGVLLTTYDIVRSNFKSLRGDCYSDDEISEDTKTWDYIILDEGHLIKNPGTQRAKSLLEIPSAHRIIISGTPLQNNLKELWALFNFCCPELLGDKIEFKNRYEAPILRGNDKNAFDREKRISSAVAQELRQRIEPFFLRRLKSEVFLENETEKSSKLSKKNEIIVWLRLTQCQRQLYEAFLNSELVLSAFDGSPLAALTILKKICDHPFMLTKRAAEDILEGMDSMLNQEELGVVERIALHLTNVTDGADSRKMHENVSCKISFIESLLDNLVAEGHCVLIFSQTRKMLNLIQELIISKGYEFLRIDGTTKATDREKIVNDFQEGKGAPIFLLTSQVGGLGLTLTKADRVIVVDPAWNPSTDNQSVDRAYRIGQKKDVLVYRLMTCGTIEEKIYRMQVFKGGLFRTATERKEQTRYFSRQDLRELFSVPKQGFDVSVTQQHLNEEHDFQQKMDDYLKNHIKFLELQGIAGVSHHSLLYSKTAAPVQLVPEDEEQLRRKQSTFVGSSLSRSTVERNVDGAAYAFKPKDLNAHRKDAAAGGMGKPKEVELKERIDRLSRTLADKAILSRLSDKGEGIRRKIAELHFELDKLEVAKKNEKEVIDLDDISAELQRVLSV